MIHSVPLHIKFSLLKRRLVIPHFQVVGLLESLWMLTATNASNGGIGKFSDQQIADALEWPGDAKELIAALTETGWLDADESYRLVVHDWVDHCPEFIKARERQREHRASKRSQTKANRVTPCHETSRLVTECHAIPNQTEPNHTEPNIREDSPSSKASPRSKEGSLKRKAEPFLKPSLEEIRSFIESRGSPIDAEAFRAFYESNGWKVGRSPMKDWQAAVITWEKRKGGAGHGTQCEATVRGDL